MNLRDPNLLDPSHPRPAPATPVNSPWRQPPPRAPSITEMVRKWLDQPHESPWTPQWTLDELQARFSIPGEYSGGGICRLSYDRSYNQRSIDERSTDDGSEDDAGSEDDGSEDNILDVDGLYDVGSHDDGGLIDGRYDNRLYDDGSDDDNERPDNDGSEDVDGSYEVVSYNNGSTVGFFGNGGLVVSKYDNGLMYETNNNELDDVDNIGLGLDDDKHNNNGYPPRPYHQVDLILAKFRLRKVDVPACPTMAQAPPYSSPSPPLSTELSYDVDKLIHTSTSTFTAESTYSGGVKYVCQLLDSTSPGVNHYDLHHHIFGLPLPPPPKMSRFNIPRLRLHTGLRHGPRATTVHMMPIFLRGSRHQPRAPSFEFCLVETLDISDDDLTSVCDVYGMIFCLADDCFSAEHWISWVIGYLGFCIACLVSCVSTHMPLFLFHGYAINRGGVLP